MFLRQPYLNGCRNSMNEIMWFQIIKRHPSKISPISRTTCVVFSTHSQASHNSCDLHIYISMWMMTEMTETKRTVLQSIKLNTFHICTPQCETWPTQSMQPNSVYFRVWNHSCQPKQATHLRLSILELSFYTFMTLYIMFEPGCFCRMAAEIIISMRLYA